MNSAVQLEQGGKGVSMGSKIRVIIVCQVEMMTGTGCEEQRRIKENLEIRGWLTGKKWLSLMTWGDIMTCLEVSRR